MGVARSQDRLHGRDMEVRERQTVHKTKLPTIWFYFKEVSKPK